MHVFGGRVRSGVESVVLWLAKELQRDGGEPILVPLVGGAFTDEARDFGFTVDPLNKRCHYDIPSIANLAQLIRLHRPHILHSHAVNGAFYACPAGRLAGSIVQVSTCHVDTAESLVDVYRWRLPRLLAAASYVYLMRWCHRITTVNNDLREDLIRRGVPAEKVVSVPNGIDMSRYNLSGQSRQAVRAQLHVPADATLIGTACRLAPFKNLPMLLAVAGQLIELQERVEFIIVGDGPERERLVRLAEHMGIDRHVHFTGWRTDVPRLLSALDIFVMTSDTEGWPITALEAMALGRPLVSTDVSFTADLTEHRRMGLIVPKRDVAKMTRAIRSLLQDEQLAGRIGRQGRALVQRTYSVKNMYRSMSYVYADALALGELSYARR